MSRLILIAGRADVILTDRRLLSVIMEDVVMDVASESQRKPNKPTRLRRIGAKLRINFKRYGDMNILHTAIERLQRAKHLIDDTQPHKPLLLTDLCIRLRLRFKRLGTLDDLADSLAAHDNVLRLTPDSYSVIKILSSTRAHVLTLPK